jgi:uncharacterized protein YuzE
MESVNLTIGSFAFDRASYDPENDVLYLHLGDPRAGEGEETPEGHVLRYAPGTTDVIGLTIIGAQRALARKGRVSITVAATVETTAEDLAPALAAR